MAKVFGIHHISLHPGVTVAAFTAFLQRISPTIEAWPGVKSHILQADRGHYAGQLLYIFEFDDLATRDRYFPVEGTMGEAGQHLNAMSAVIAEWQQYATFSDGDKVRWGDFVSLTEF